MVEKLVFAPILKEMTEYIINELKPVQLFHYEGVDIRELDSFELEGEKGYCRIFKTDKVEKISVSSMNFFGKMTADVMIITPAADYDIPYFVMDWDESEGHVFFIADLMPSDDPGRNSLYLTNYLYTPLENLYQTYCEIPGLKNSVFHWVRAIHSPYIITGTIEKTSRKNVDLLCNCAKDYLKAWVALYNEAKPHDPNSPYMQLVHERRKTIREYYRQNDPGAGPLKKFLGKEKAEKAIAVIEP